MKSHKKSKRKARKHASPKIRSRKPQARKKAEDGDFYAAAVQAAVKVLSRRASSANSPSSTHSITDIGSMYGEFSSSAMPNLTRMPPVDLDNLRRATEQRERQINEILSKLRTCARAPGALADLRRVGINERDIVPYLGSIWQACRNKPKRLTNVPSVSLKDIRKLPDLLREVARQISAINEHRAMPSVVWFRIRKELPGALYGYALDLERKLLEPAPKMKPGTAEKVQFAHFVRTTASDGKPHHRELATLINAFNEIEDGKQGVTSKRKRVTLASLKVLCGKHPEFAKLPTPLPIPRGVPALGKLN